MKIDIVPYARQHEGPVRQFNARLQAGRGPAVGFPDCHVPEWLPKTRSGRLYQEFSLAVDETSAVRGGYILKHQEFLVAGSLRSIADYHWPISEAIVESRYNPVGLKLLADAMRKEPRLFALGMGGHEHPLPRILKALGWSLAEVPFFFDVVRARAFFRNIAPLRTTPLRRTACDLAASTGLGWAALRASRLRPPARRIPRSIAWEEVDTFSGWADDLWHASKEHYALVAVRDQDVLNTLYPPESERFIRLEVFRDGKPIGWAVLLATAMSGHKQFGDMKVGTLVDCLAAPADAIFVVAAARRILRARGVDLIVSNQSHAAWCGALRSCGFFEGPSNFLFAASPALAADLQPFDQQRRLFHLTRGDGDGPIHL